MGQPEKLPAQGRGRQTTGGRRSQRPGQLERAVAQQLHRRFQQWCERQVLRDVLTKLANALRQQGDIDESESYIDATFASAKGGGDEIGKTRRGKGVKILAIVDRHGLPLLVSTHVANHHEVTLVQLSFDFYMIEAKPQHLIGDKACDSDALDKELRRTAWS